VVTSVAAQGLEFSYPGPVHAVRGVDLEFGDGRLTCILGPNGSGKTTLLRLLAGLLTPARGAVTVDGRPVHTLSGRERAHNIALVPQALDALPEVTAENFVLSGRYSHLGFWRQHNAHDLEVVRSALAATDCADFGARLLPHLSGGQRQRVLVSRALAQEAQILLVDEPTNSLDPEHQLIVFKLLAELAAQGKTVLVVTHDINLASQFSAELVLMQDGVAVAQGTPQAVLTPETLTPIYGADLRFGTFPDSDEAAARPFVLPWASSPSSG